MNDLNSGSTVHGFDPLASQEEHGGLNRQIADAAIKREVNNILKSYTGYFDIFSELLQNALDAIDLRSAIESSDHYLPKIWVEIDIANNRIKVTDNGVGMSIDEFRYCFRPNVSFKERRKTRGHKGVGASFIAYGFTSVWLQSRKNSNEISARLNNGRQWAEDFTESFPRPTFDEVNFKCAELNGEPSGTSVEVIIGDGNRPRLSWLNATNASQWLDILRIKTPAGGIYLSAESRKNSPVINIRVIDYSGSLTEESAQNIDYYYPHEIKIINKCQSVDAIEAAKNSLKGDPATVLTRLPDEFRRLDAVYEVWRRDDILNNKILSRNLDQDERELIDKHNVVVYGCFLSSATTWTSFQRDVLRVRASAILLRGGLQIASDYMPQGDLLVIPLTSTIGYQANTHIIVHLDDGNPDMGRKVFQPEVKHLAEELARRAVDIFKSYLNLMREDTGAPTLNAARDLRDFIRFQEDHRIKKPLELKADDRRISLLSEPQSEQDVIALFHQLVGIGVFRGIGILATSESERYDSIFTLHYPDRSFVFGSLCSLGVAEENIDDRESIPMVLEYKFSSDSVVGDFHKEKKFISDIDLLVCWNIGSQTRSEYALRSYLIGDEGSTRTMFGATHCAYQDRTKQFEIICLEDLIRFLIDPSSEIARQKQTYK